MNISSKMIYNNIQNISCFGNEPNWEYIPSATKPKLTETEFIERIKKFANRIAHAKTTEEHDILYKKLQRLETEYLSSVAPDRKRLYHSAKKTMGMSNIYNPQYSKAKELSLLDFLEQADGHGDITVQKIAIGNGGMLTFVNLTGGGYGVIIKCEGTEILSNTGYGWEYQLTGAEQKKSDKFYSIYRSEYNSIKGNNEILNPSEYVENPVTFDVKA